MFGTWTNDYSSLKDHAIQCHWHDDLEFHLVLQGQIDLYLNGSLLQLETGDCVFINGNTLHTSQQGKNSECSLMLITAFHPQIFSSSLGDQIYRKYFDSLLQHTNGFLIDRKLSCGQRIAELLRELHAFDKNQEGYELLCLHQLSNIWYQTVQYMNQTVDMTYIPDLKKSNSIEVKKILAYIHDHYDQPMEIEDLLRCSNLSRSECFRSFKRFIGKTPIEYINEYRLSQSAVMLTNTDRNVMEICISCGITSPSYYGKLFKEKYGLSPLAFRNRNCK